MMFVNLSCVACETKPQIFEPNVLTPCFLARKIYRLFKRKTAKERVGGGRHLKIHEIHELTNFFDLLLQ